MAVIEDPLFPEDVGRGAQRTLLRQIATVTNEYGYRQTSCKSPEGMLRVYSYDRRVLSNADYFEVRNFFVATCGGADGFLFTDWKDNSTTKSQQVDGDGTTTEFDLFKAYNLLPSSVEKFRRVYYPKVSTIMVYHDDVEQLSGYTWNTTTKQIDYSVAPANAVVRTASFTYYVPVIFDEELSGTNQILNLNDWERIVLREIIPDV